MGFLYGADYNPEQWIKYPDILKQDIELMKKANCNIMSVGIFGWSTMEATEGEYDFSFYDEVIERLYKNDIKVIFASPSGARPAWLSQKYPEVSRCDEYGIRHTHGRRHNHCFTSPVYREKVNKINTQIANHFKDNPAIYAWHISNEYGGDCHCPLCAQAFREYLKKRYNNDLDELNSKWWHSVWSHTYTDWSQIEPPSEIGENSSNSLKLNWKRFVTHQTLDFYINEIKPFKEITPNIPVTTNFHGDLTDINYFKFEKYVDFTCWDAYPIWSSPDGDFKPASEISLVYDLCRSIKNKPFLLMESTPSNVHRLDYNKYKRPGVNILSSLQAVANGSNSVQFFQWRKCRGGCEKYHGAIVDQCGRDDTRIFKECAKLGLILKNLSEVYNSAVKADAAVIYDWENRWAIDNADGFQYKDKKYLQECQAHYNYFLNNGINTDVIGIDKDFSNYKIIAAPMLYSISPQNIKRLCEFVKGGGILVSGFMTGYADEDDLCYIGGFPAQELKDLFGIWNEEIDTLYPQDKNTVSAFGNNYTAIDYCEVIHTEKADVLGTYKSDYYNGLPAVTVNSYGKGKAYYIAFRSCENFINDFYKLLNINIYSAKFDIDYESGVTVRTRQNNDYTYYFIQNWNEKSSEIFLKGNFVTIPDKNKVTGKVTLNKYETVILGKENK